MTPKPKTEIIKLEFSKEDQEYIDAMLEGRPTPKTIREWSEKGFDVEHKTKRYTCPTFKDRIMNSLTNVLNAYGYTLATLQRHNILRKKFDPSEWI